MYTLASWGGEKCCSILNFHIIKLNKYLLQANNTTVKLLKTSEKGNSIVEAKKPA